jgi:hypothetical protein
MLKIIASVFDAHPDFNHVFSVHLYSPPLKELVYKDPSGRVASQPVVCYHLEGYTAGIKDFTDDVVVPAAPSKSPKVLVSECSSTKMLLSCFVDVPLRIKRQKG